MKRDQKLRCTVMSMQYIPKRKPMPNVFGIVPQESAEHQRWTKTTQLLSNACGRHMPTYG